MSTRPTGQRDETEEAAFDGTAVVLLADGGSSGESDGTGVLASTNRI